MISATETQQTTPNTSLIRLSPLKRLRNTKTPLQTKLYKIVFAQRIRCQDVQALA